MSKNIRISEETFERMGEIKGENSWDSLMNKLVVAYESLPDGMKLIFEVKDKSFLIGVYLTGAMFNTIQVTDRMFFEQNKLLLDSLGVDKENFQKMYVRVSDKIFSDSKFGYLKKYLELASSELINGDENIDLDDIPLYFAMGMGYILKKR